MMVKCLVSSCPNRKELTTKHGGPSRALKRFYNFPKDPARIKVWLAALREPDKQDWSESHVICEDHFLPEDLTVHGVSPDAIPIMPPCLEEGLSISAWHEDPDDDQWTAGGVDDEEEEEEEAPTPAFAQRVPDKPAAPPPDRSTETSPGTQKQSVSPKEKPQQSVASPPSQLPPKTSRQDVSLHLLTRRFLELLLNSEGSLDLRGVADSLQTRKRRVYDVSNVLEGINVLQRDRLTCRVRWIGKCPISSFLWDLQKMQREYEKLKLVEETLDGLIKSCAQQLFNMTDDQKNAASAYVTCSDLQTLSVLTDQTIVVVQAPEETKLEVPAPKEDSIQIHLKSGRGPIRAVTCDVWPDLLRLRENSFSELEDSRINTRPLQTGSSSSQRTVSSL